MARQVAVHNFSNKLQVENLNLSQFLLLCFDSQNDNPDFLNLLTLAFFLFSFKSKVYVNKPKTILALTEVIRRCVPEIPPQFAKP